MFDGKLSVDDIQNMELPLLLNLEKKKAKQIEKEAQRVTQMQQKAAADSKNGTVVNKGSSNK
jgi:hypothetical protein